MKTILAILVMLIGCHIAKAEDAKTAALQKDHCERYLSARSGARTNQRQAEAAGWRFAYTRCMMDAMADGLARSDDLHKQVVGGVWSDNVTVDQLIRVFVRFANANPQKLNQPAIAVFRESAEAAGLYNYQPVAAGK
jgi:hypothetical protein